LVDVAAIQRTDDYHAAKSLFSEKSFRSSETKIDALLTTPGLSASAQEFLKYQKSLCENAINGKKPVIARIAPVVRPKLTAAQADCGPRALFLVCEKMKTPANLDSLRKVAGTTGDGTSLAGLAKAAQSVGFKADGVQMDKFALMNLNSPAISWTDGNHYVAVLSVKGDTATVRDPNKSGEEDMPLGGPTGLLARSGGMLLVLTPGKSHT
jgi:hypothetical protein